MALSTKSKFYYGWKVTENNRYIDFTFDSVDYTAELDLGSYTAQELADEAALKMNDAAGTSAFTVTFDRTTREFTFSEASGFSFLFSSGVNASFSACGLFGFDPDDSTGTSLTSNFESGSVWSPQLQLQSYKPTTNNRYAIDGVVNKSASGVVEVVKYGNERFMECEAVFITNVRQDDGSIITNSQTAVEDYISFIEYATDKNTVEFMPDSTDVETYQAFILESTSQDDKGLNYELIELYDRGLAEYYRSGILKFKLME